MSLALDTGDGDEGVGLFEKRKREGDSEKGPTIIGNPTRTATVVVAKDGSGDTDDIQEGLNLLPSGGGVVFIKEGTYIITKAISITKDNTSLIGSGRSTKIQTNTDIRMITGSSRRGLFISNLLLFGMGTGLADEGIIFTTVTESIVSNVWIENTGMEGIVLGTNSDDNKIEGNILTDVRIGVFIDGGTDNAVVGNICNSNSVYGISTTTNNNTITGNTCNTNTNSGIFCSGDGNTFTGNTASTNTLYGIFCSGDDNTFTGNVVNTNVRHGFFFSGANNNTITGNIVVGNDSGNTATYDGIIIDVDSDENIISSNVCQGNDRDEIRIDDNTCDKNMIIGNICLGTHTAAIVDNGTNTHPNGASGTTNLTLDDLNIIA